MPIGYGGGTAENDDEDEAAVAAEAGAARRALLRRALLMWALNRVLRQGLPRGLLLGRTLLGQALLR